MKYITEFRNKKTAEALQYAIAKAAQGKENYRLMEFCGGHTHAIHRYGIPALLPKHVELLHGPGCPVCVLPIARIDHAIQLSLQPNIILCSYGDMLRVPGSEQQSLLKARAQGANIRMVYAVTDALKIARENPEKEVVFFAIGFETTTPPTAAALVAAKQENLKNFSIFCNHVLTPVAMSALLSGSSEDINIDGFIGPAHVSIVIGTNAYVDVANQFKKPVVIAGFEPLDVMHAILMLINQLNKNAYGVENQYTRAVTETGNIKAQALILETLSLRDTFEWRGLGMIAQSAMRINKKYQQFDAEIRFPLTIKTSQAHKACDCPAILRGAKKPMDCKLFATVCTPENPLGSCMVSSEGACSAYYAYGRRNARSSHKEVV